MKKKAAKAKVVVIMGPTAAGKSKLSVDLSRHFPIEIINADSMQVYTSLDVLTNKLPLPDRLGVPHHLLGTVSPDVEFTAREFRDSAIRLIDEIVARSHLPVIVGGTNYYIQALVSPFLLDDTMDLDQSILNHSPDDEEQLDHLADPVVESLNSGYDSLKELDPVAANRIHPNNHRKINQFLKMYSCSGVLPSKLYQGKAAENWGRIDNSRFDCCFICVNAANLVLDKHVEQRVDCMIDAGLLDEVYEIYNPNGSYTRGLRQAIGVREFKDFLKTYLLKVSHSNTTDFADESIFNVSANNKNIQDDMKDILHSSDVSELKILLVDAIAQVKANTRRLVRCQAR